MKTILIVDDQNSVLITLESILKTAGYIVISCRNASDAYDRIQSERIDLLITDAIMPASSTGYNLISTIRSQPNLNNKVPIIMLTGKRDAADVEKAIKVGANDYMIKPIDPDILLEKVKKLVSKNNSEESEFVQAPVNFAATIPMKIQIISASETDLRISANVHFLTGQIYNISSDFFDIFDKKTISIRVNKSETIDKQCLIQATYVGLSETELSQIRHWVRNKLLTLKND